MRPSYCNFLIQYLSSERLCAYLKIQGSIFHLVLIIFVVLLTSIKVMALQCKDIVDTDSLPKLILNKYVSFEKISPSITELSRLYPGISVKFINEVLLPDLIAAVRNENTDRIVRDFMVQYRLQDYIAYVKKYGYAVHGIVPRATDFLEYREELAHAADRGYFYDVQKSEELRIAKLKKSASHFRELNLKPWDMAMLLNLLDPFTFGLNENYLSGVKNQVTELLTKMTKLWGLSHGDATIVLSHLQKQRIRFKELSQRIGKKDLPQFLSLQKIAKLIEEIKARPIVKNNPFRYTELDQFGFEFSIRQQAKIFFASKLSNHPTIHFFEQFGFAFRQNSVKVPDLNKLMSSLVHFSSKTPIGWSKRPMTLVRKFELEDGNVIYLGFGEEIPPTATPAIHSNINEYDYYNLAAQDRNVVGDSNLNKGRSVAVVPDLFHDISHLISYWQNPNLQPITRLIPTLKNTYHKRWLDDQHESSFGVYPDAKKKFISQAWNAIGIRQERLYKLTESKSITLTLKHLKGEFTNAELFQIARHIQDNVFQYFFPIGGASADIISIVAWNDGRTARRLYGWNDFLIASVTKKIPANYQDFLNMTEKDQAQLLNEEFFQILFKILFSEFVNPDVLRKKLIPLPEDENWTDPDLIDLNNHLQWLIS